MGHNRAGIRNAPIIQQQKNILIEYMKNHEELQTGRFTQTFTFKAAQKLWEDVTEILNSIAGGTKKDWRQWRKTWQDVKKNAKMKVTQNKKHTVQTGGGEFVEVPLNKDENEIINMISPVAIDGLEVQEPQICFDFQIGSNKENIQPSIDTKEMQVHSASTSNSTSNKHTSDVEDHIYTLPSTSYAPKKKSTKTQRFNTTTKLATQLLQEVYKKTNIIEEYYDAKTKYLQHKIKYEEKKIELMQARNTILTNIHEQVGCCIQILQQK